MKKGFITLNRIRKIVTKYYTPRACARELVINEHVRARDVDGATQVAGGVDHPNLFAHTQTSYVGRSVTSYMGRTSLFAHYIGT